MSETQPDSTLARLSEAAKAMNEPLAGWARKFRQAFGMPSPDGEDEAPAWDRFAATVEAVRQSGQYDR